MLKNMPVREKLENSAARQSYENLGGLLKCGRNGGESAKFATLMRSRLVDRVDP